MIKCYREGQQVLHDADVTPDDIDHAEETAQRLSLLYKKWRTIFNWQDGPLVQAMKNGDLFLVDEISLADDSVLERLNSVLEPERKLTLAEKGGSDLEKITAHDKFFLLATMNPGGDYGKKELSPALRNRFTEIWVPPVSELNELQCIALDKILNPELSFVADVMINFWEWFNRLQTGRMLTVRDLLSWIDFINVTEKKLVPEVALLHGAFLVLLDGLSLGTGISKLEAEKLRDRCLSFLMGQLKESKLRSNQGNVLMTEYNGWSDFLKSAEAPPSSGMEIDGSYGIHPYYIEKGNNPQKDEGFAFRAPTTRRNSLRVLRAMQLKKPVLLEGSPGVGKTSLVLALGNISGHSVVRINLSEQTDMMDLLGSDLPAESDEGMQFAWSDGILLQALKNGSWVLLDELNLAPQSVLEGLNAILDHRAEVFIPELGHTFKCPSSFRVFACQNPSSQGGGRKGLPKSFLNRFTKVYVDELVEEDHHFICSSKYPSIPKPLLSNLITFNKRLYEDTMINHKFGQSGFPWEFNLRDILRSCAPENSKMDCFLNTVYVQRMRSTTDRQEVVNLYEQVFGVKTLINLYPRVQLNPESLIVGNTYVKRNNNNIQSSSSTRELKILPGQRQSLETVAQCLHHQWLVLLIGPAASGKTSLIRLMSQLTGNVLNELSLSSATDISELLGCFEQYSAIRHYRLAIDQVSRYMNSYMSTTNETTFDEKQKKKLIASWLRFSSTLDHNSSSASFVVENGGYQGEVFRSLPLLIDTIKNLKPIMKNVSGDLDRLLKIVTKLQDDQRRKVQYPAKFEWVTGLLIKAIENGEWIVLENANLCNPTVLDRINSLVEQSGSITVNECGTLEGKPMVLKPHPQFRMFLTVNPTYGEVSRAMRNRGVEIYLMQPYGLTDLTEYESEGKDVKRFLALSSIPGEVLVDLMAKAHLEVKKLGLQHDVVISNLDLMRWVQLFQRLVTNGNQALWSLKISFEHTYLSSSLGHIVEKDNINEVIGSLHDGIYSSYSSCSLCLPGRWPTTLTVCDFVRYSVETSVKQNCMYVEYLGAQMAHQTRFDPPKLMQKQLFFAANWAIEQVTETDLEVYLLWLEWLGDNLQGYCCSFFPTFIKLLKEERDHSIWKRIRECGSRNSATPMLALGRYSNPDDYAMKSEEVLQRAVKCVELLRVSYHQWHAESQFKYNSFETQCFIPVLQSLRKLEKGILDMILDSPFFNEVFELYRRLINHHLSAWNRLVVSSQSPREDCTLLIYWRSLVKDARKLKQFCCASEVEMFQNDMKNLDKELSWNLNSPRSLLWAYGGHPVTPSSVEIYNKQQMLVNLCHDIWTRKQDPVQKDSIKTAVSTNPNLRALAMQGVCLASFIMSKVNEENLDGSKQMEDMHSMLKSNFDNEEEKLKRNRLMTNEQASSSFGSCCVMNNDMLCHPSFLSCWLDTLPLNDNTSFGLDMRLLQELSNTLVLDGKQLESGLSCLRWQLESTLKFSVDCSSRPPTDFSPHKKILWVLDAWTSVNSADASISSTVMEMWFNWHTSLWKHQSNHEKTSLSHADLVPDMLFQPVATLSLDKILQSPISIKYLNAHILKLGVASRNLWLSSPHVAECRHFFTSCARSLFQQIILAHEKSFEADKFSLIKSAFFSAQVDTSVIMRLLKSSTHSVLKSLRTPIIKPLLDVLYSQNSKDYLFSLGCAWLRVGGLRYRLLVCCDDVDPAVKKNFKYIQLTERIASLELDIQVRQECVHLAGCFSLSEVDKEKTRLLNELKAERNRLPRQVVRSNTGKFKNLRSECEEFMKSVHRLEGSNMNRVADQKVHKNWQQTAMHFLDRLSNEYSEYVDIIQPVQIAIYEMKLGLSLVLSNCLRDQFLDRVGQKNMDVVLVHIINLSLLSHRNLAVDPDVEFSVDWQEAIYSFVRFPRGMTRQFALHIEEIYNAKVSHYFDKSFPTYMGEDDMKLVETLVTSSRDNNNKDKEESVLQLRASIHQNSLLRVVHYVGQAHFLDNASFKLLDKMFNEFANLWMKMKNQVRTKEELDSQKYRFRPRAFDIKDVIEVDISTLGKTTIANDEAFSEWQELTTNDEVEVSVETQWTEIVSNCCCFYYSGGGFSSDLEGLLCSSLDSKLTPEHALRLCLERDKKLLSSHLPGSSYNFYKDSNASLLAKMVGPLMNLQQRIRHLMTEWDDHPALQKIVDVIDMILCIPMNTPLAKAMSGLQFLLNRVWNLRETVSKFPLSDQLDPIIALVSSWQKMEFESWPALLDDVQARFDTNAGQLWFPLYSVLRQSHSADTNDYIQATMQRHTSSIGEFKKRLQLVFAFHGHISRSIGQKSSLSLGHEDNLKILYNTFGFYIQFLPIILEQLASNRKNIEGEVKELLKLCKWEANDWSRAMESSKGKREKFKKLIQKYTDVLKQPVMLILNQAAAALQSGIINTATAVVDRTVFSNSFEKYKQVLDAARHETIFQNQRRFVWPSTWRNKVDVAFKDMHIVGAKESDLICVNLKEAKGNIDTVSKIIDFQSSSDVTKEEWVQIQDTFEKVTTNVIDCGELFKEEKKMSAKKRALSELLKLLESCGLSKHRSSTEDHQSMKIIKSSQWFLQPCYNMEHLLLKEGRLSSSDVAAPVLETIWKTANEYFFKTISSLGHLQQVCFNFHKDFTLVEVNKSVSYINHLVNIQKSQRAAAYDLAKGLELLKKRSLPLQNLFSSSCSFSHNQDIVCECMWLQKQLFDAMCNILSDECLLLQTVENNHLNNCQNVGAAATWIHRFLEKCAPEFKQVKEMLDSYLFGDCGSLISTSVVLYPYGVTKQMERFVEKNFLIIKDFREKLLDIRTQDLHAGLAKTVLLDHFEDIIANGNLLYEYYTSTLEKSNKAKNNYDAVKISSAEAQFTKSLGKTCKQIVDGFVRVNSVNKRPRPSDDYLGNINTWQILFASRVESLQLHTIHDELVKTLNIAGELMNLYRNEETTRIGLVEAQLKHMYSLLDLMINFGSGLLNDFMAAHTTLSMVTHALAEIFASLYSQGFGCLTENEEEENGAQDATGTGMGEGAGVKDVSEQIEDEDQLLGTEKGGEEQDASNEVPSKDDKGIEMEQDFNADSFSVSEDETEDDENNDEPEELDSAMGETGNNSEVVDEKLGENKDDEKNEKNEKYETGPSVKEDGSSSDRELRAKEEDDMPNTDEAGELKNPADESSNKQDDENDDNVPDDAEDMNIDKDEAFAEPTGLKPDDDGDIDMNQQDEVDHDEVEGTENLDDSADGQEDTQENPPDENGPDAVTENTEMDTEETGQANGTDDADMESQKNGITAEEVANNLDTGFQQNHESATQPNSGSNGASMRNVASEVTWSNTDDMQIELAPIQGLPDSSQNEVSIAGAGKLDDQQDIDRLPPEVDPPPSLLEKKYEPNPLRNIGDALDGWKEQAKVSVDLEEKKDGQMDGLDEDDQNADEYGFTSGLEKGTAQALGPAAVDQLDKNIDRKELPADGDGGHADQKDDDSEMDVNDQHHEPVKNHHPLNNNIGLHDKMEVEEEKVIPEEVFNPLEDVDRSRLESSVHVTRSSYMTDEASQFGQLISGVDNDDDMGKSHNLEDVVPGEMKEDSATALWRRCELQTTRLSQELAEQLRLVMEPTLASKLQGDYKTGKRINMKKVIGYIASHYRKDKIWDRRTRPNKRNYQVVIAVDDSRSMSENNCGNVAIEALVTVCRAMSQLEVGSLAVASFGKTGNVKLLHDFDHPFTAEAGVKKDLKRCVSDILSKNRMVAFLILDNPKDSITDMKEATFDGQNWRTVKYMDSFLFPFYVILKDIQTLPRTLADLLRQWFELMQQHSRA
ncbi:hypothetical protein SSX86_017802 [Deinandra increscens subsp. villosa]|uniref:AAA+ ATPase domain-containing protein n=1 Tax=Deinandra increscens subsp. villosa TaxID=3103831 RepID=A0AAP0GYX4_9ASTR